MTANRGPAQVILLGGPSGCGKSYLARRSGLPVVSLDDFYRDGDAPDMPRMVGMDMVDWDDVRAWDAALAVDTLERLCREGRAEVPVYEIGADRRVGVHTVVTGGAAAIIAEGLFAAEIADPLRQRGLLGDAITVHRSPLKNFARRLTRDLAERRKSPVTLVRRGLRLMHAEREVVQRQALAGFRELNAPGTTDALARWAHRP